MMNREYIDEEPREIGKKKGKKPEECYKTYREVRVQSKVLLLLLIILIPSVILVYFGVKTNVEKVYVVQFSNTFNIPTFEVNCYNQSSGVMENITINSIRNVTIDKIQFGFNEFTSHYTDVDYQQALIYLASNDYMLNYNIRIGYYDIREFDINNVSSIPNYGFKFKMTPNDRLFFIGLHFTGQIGNCTVDTTFYKFIDTSNQPTDFAECDMTIDQLNFIQNIFDTPNYQGNYLYPYVLHLNLFYFTSSLYMFDFSFR